MNVPMLTTTSRPVSAIRFPANNLHCDSNLVQHRFRPKVYESRLIIRQSGFLFGLIAAKVLSCVVGIDRRHPCAAIKVHATVARFVSAWQPLSQGLLMIGRPLAVTGFVIAVKVNTVDGLALWPLAHVSVEV